MSEGGRVFLRGMASEAYGLDKLRRRQRRTRASGASA